MTSSAPASHAETPQTTLDEFTGGDLLVGADAPGATVKPDPQQGDLFRPEARQLRFEMPTAPAAHPRGEIGGVLDVSEFGGMSCYIDQTTDLQDHLYQPGYPCKYLPAYR